MQSGTESSKKRPKRERPQYTSFFTHTKEKKQRGEVWGVQKDKASRHSLQLGLRREEITTNSHSSGV